MKYSIFLFFVLATIQPAASQEGTPPLDHDHAYLAFQIQYEGESGTSDDIYPVQLLHMRGVAEVMEDLVPVTSEEAEPRRYRVWVRLTYTEHGGLKGIFFYIIRLDRVNGECKWTLQYEHPTTIQTRRPRDFMKLRDAFLIARSQINNEL